MRTVSLQLAEDTVAGAGVPDDENGAIKLALGYLWQFVAQYPQPASLLNYYHPCPARKTHQNGIFMFATQTPLRSLIIEEFILHNIPPSHDTIHTTNIARK